MDRPRIVLALGALVLFVVGLAALAIVDRVDERVAAARLTDRVTLTESVAAAHAVGFDAAMQDTRSVARLLEPFDDSPEAQAAAAEQLEAVRGLGVLDAVLLVGPVGTVRAADPGSSDLVGRPQRGAHLDAALGGDEVFGGPMAGDEIARVPVAVPIHDASDRIAGAVIGLFTPSRAAVPSSQAERFQLAWEDGTAVGSDGVAARDDLARSHAQRAASGAGVRRTSDSAGTDVVVSYAPVVPGWSVTGVEPAGSFDAGRRQPLLVTGAALMLLVATAGLMIAVQQRRLLAARREFDDAKRALLAVAGHELRTPVTVVAALGQTLERRWDDLPDEQRRDLVLTVGRHARTLRHLVERLMFAAALAARRNPRIQVRSIDLRDVATRATDAHAPLAPTHRFLLDADGPVVAEADPEALDQVLFHLLDNAVRYSPGGGTVLVRVQATPEPTLSVLDQGVGLPSDTAVLFERFGQVEDVDTRVLEEGGVGLGLYIVQRLVELQGGHIAATNRPEGGARFDVVLPRAS